MFSSEAPLKATEGADGRFIAFRAIEDTQQLFLRHLIFPPAFLDFHYILHAATFAPFVIGISDNHTFCGWGGWGFVLVGPPPPSGPEGVSNTPLILCQCGVEWNVASDLAARRRVGGRFKDFVDSWK